MLDLDDFKQVNDRFGHAAGDQMLRGLADLLQARVRTVDILARIGGDEYILLLPETEIFAALNVAERLRLGAADLAIASTAGVARATVSIGLARLTNDTRDLEALYQRADAAMYAAKAQGGNRVVMA
jgi:diguanylate cyclase (GGDEF)-like protein